MFFVQCSSCGVPVGIVDYFPNSAITARIDELEKGLKSIEADTSAIENSVAMLSRRLK